MSLVTEVRNPINVGRLESYLTHLPDTETTTRGVIVPKFAAPFEIKQFKFGQSNPTYYLVDSHGKEFVLRRKPSPNAKLVSRSAHAIEREFFLLRGIGFLNKSQLDRLRKVPVPKVYVLCEDESIIGTVFYVMEYITGQQLRNPDMPEIKSQADKDKYWNSIMETISAIHLMDGEKLISYLPAKHFPQFQSIEKLKSLSYFKRQVKTLSGVSAGQLKVVDPIPHFDEMCQWLLSHAPNDPAKLSLIHGDFKIDNILFDPETKTVNAVLDWELSTFGHPLFDLSNLVQPFQLPNKLNLMFFHPDPTDIGSENPDSIKTSIEKLKLYYEKYNGHWDPKDLSNNPVDLWLVGYVFGLLRLCVISQGIALRVKKGVASSGSASGYASLYPYLASLAIKGMKEYDSAKQSKL
jgi:aminoglycoside phosphotransferase (APT) family kinase protein